MLNIFKKKSTGQTEGAVYRKVHNDIELAIDRMPDQSITKTKLPDRIGMVASDFPLCRFKPLVKAGDNISVGTPLMVDRRRSERMLTSSVAGSVSSINYGPRRRLHSLVVDTGLTQTEQQPQTVPADAEGVKQCLQKSGVWPAQRSRPFGCIADPEQKPTAIFVTATRSDPMAPDVETVIREFHAEFTAGLALLRVIHSDLTYLCVAPETEQFMHETVKGIENIVLSVFQGMYPAGLPGTHVHMLEPVSEVDRPVWHIDYQDVISFGYLKTHGVPWHHRVISLVGSAVNEPGLLLVPLGSSIEDIAANELINSGATVFSGSALSGIKAKGRGDFLGRYHHQITAVTGAQDASAKGEADDRNDGSNKKGWGNLVPFETLEHCLPKDMLAIPFLRSLLVGDTEQAVKLGALSFVEEDLAMAKLFCSSGADYPQLLRGTLDALAADCA